MSEGIRRSPTIEDVLLVVVVDNADAGGDLAKSGEEGNADGLGKPPPSPPPPPPWIELETLIRRRSPCQRTFHQPRSAAGAELSSSRTGARIIWRSACSSAVG